MEKFIRITNCDVAIVINCPDSLVDLIIDRSKEFFKCELVRNRKQNEWMITTNHLLDMNDPNTHKIVQKYSHLDEPKRIFLINKKKLILEVLQPVDSEWLVQILIRLSRDALRNLAYDRMYYLHGAFVVYNDYGICILGKKRSGKTTSVLNILSKGIGTSFISNDDVSIAYENGEWIAYGWPRSLSVRKDSITALEKKGFNFNKSIELTHPYNKNGVSEECVTFYPSDFAVFTNSKISASHRLDMVIFTSFGDENKIVALEKKDGEQKLNNCILKNINDYFGELGQYFIRENTNDRPIKGDIKYLEIQQNFENLLDLTKVVDEFNNN